MHVFKKALVNIKCILIHKHAVMHARKHARTCMHANTHTHAGVSFVFYGKFLRHTTLNNVNVFMKTQNPLGSVV